MFDRYGSYDYVILGIALGVVLGSLALRGAASRAMR
jgi:hypothetical protein